MKKRNNKAEINPWILVFVILGVIALVVWAFFYQPVEKIKCEI